MKKAASIMLLVLLAATLLTACSDKKSAVGGGSTVFSAAGGEGINTGGYGGYGGSGGAFNVYPYDNTTVKISRSGSVDTSVDTSFFDKAISSASFTTGAVPMNVTTNMTVKTYPTSSIGTDDTGVSAGEFHTHGPQTILNVDYCTSGQDYYYTSTNSTLYRRNDANDNDEVVTGIHVSPGVTLTFQPNYLYLYNYCGGVAPDIYAYGLEEVVISVLDNGIWNEGTITVQDYVTGANEVGNTYRTTSRSALDKVPFNLQMYGTLKNDGLITTRGTDTTLTKGGDGGYLYLWSGDAIVNRGTINSAGGNGNGGGYGGSGAGLALSSSLVIVNSGTLESSGGNGTDGGGAGRPDLNANYGIWNTGPVNAKGGTGTAGIGGNGNTIYFNADEWQAVLYNSGTLNSSGGDGTAGGGHASGAELIAGNSYYNGCGALVNSGNIIGNGGNATISGSGGWGASYNASGYHYLGAFGCDLSNSGTIELKGGNGAGVGSYGGYGGYLYVFTAVNYDYNSDALVAPGSIFFGGNVLADGGTGQYGGSGGYVKLYNNDYFNNLNGNSYTVYPTNSGSIEVLGFSNVNLKGGKGATHGGSGGYSELFWDISNYNYTNVDYNGNYFFTTPSSIYNDTNFDISGGQGVTGIGGWGGAFYAELRSDYLYWNWSTAKPGAKSAFDAPGSIENHGAITTKGGQGALNGGSAGYEYYWYDGNYYPSSYDDDISIFMFASGNIMNTGALNASGGSATDAAGYGGYGSPIVLDAVGNVLNSGSINASGGNGPLSGGGASLVYFFSYAGTNVNTAAITANGGNANTVDGNGGGGGYVEIYTNNGPLEATSSTVPSVAGGTGFTTNGDGWYSLGWW